MTLKKTFAFISSILIFSMIFSVPLGALAAVEPDLPSGSTNSSDVASSNALFNNNTDTSGVTSAAQNLRQQGATEMGNNGKSNNTNYAGTSIASAAANCSIGQIASQMIVSTVSKAIGSLTGTAQNQATSQAQQQAQGQGKGQSAVPTNEQGPLLTHGEHIDAASAAIDQKAAQQNSVNVTTSASTGGENLFNGITSMFSNIFKFPSLNAIGFCVVNEMIQYIAKSTVQWINSGFKGSPVFVSNTGQFFKGVADQEMGNFVNGLANGTLGINLCQPFKVAVLTSTLGGYTGGGYNPLNCSLNQIKNNYNQFTKGNWSSGGFPGWFELIQQPNNVYGASLSAQDQAYASISMKQNTALIDLNWAKGYKDFNVCSDKSSPKADTGLCANGEHPVKQTLGGYIENQVNERGAAGMKRLYVATAFDQVVSALVNQLIQIAINKVFDSNNSGNNK